MHALKIAEHVVTVTGKTFYDIAHAPADHSNRRHSPKDYAVWEIHPGDETGSGSMKHWEIIADNLSRAGFRLGWVSAFDLGGRTIWIVNAHRDKGKRRGAKISV